jgi:hypothetical protein
MSLKWRAPQQARIEAGMRRFPAESGMCAPLARVVLAVAVEEDPLATGVQIKPRAPARYVNPRHSKVRFWYSHTLVCTRAHHVDALTGVEWCEQARYLEVHWRYPEELMVEAVDVAEVDPGVQHADE